MKTHGWFHLRVKFDCQCSYQISKTICKPNSQSSDFCRVQFSNQSAKYMHDKQASCYILNAQWDENRKSVRFQRRHLSWTRPFLKPQYLEILMLNQKFFKYGFNYNWTNLSEKNKTIFENRFLKGGKIGLKMGYFQVPILDSCRRLPRYWHISL